MPTEEDQRLVKESTFEEFKQLFSFNPTFTLADSVNLVYAVRNYIEGYVIHTPMKDGYKKHMWLNQKLYDLLKYNCTLLLHQSVEEGRKKSEEEKAAKESEVTKEIVNNLVDQHQNELRN